MNDKAKGYLYGLLSSSSFGLIPLFTLPLLMSGMTTPTVLLYRFGLAMVMVGIVLKIQGVSYAVKRSHLKWLLLLGALYFCTAYLLQVGYKYMTSGAATVLHFMYPIFTALLMFIFFRQKLGYLGQIAIVMAIVGVGMMSGLNHASIDSYKGVLVVLISSLGYAIYIIVVNKSNVGELSPLLLNFYVLSIAAAIYAVQVALSGEFRWPMNRYEWGNALLLAAIPTVLSNLFLVKAIPIIGSTPTSIMGALEPLTAVIVGVIAFGEPLTSNSITGIVLVIGAVLLLVLSKSRRKDYSSQKSPNISSSSSSSSSRNSSTHQSPD